MPTEVDLDFQDVEPGQVYTTEYEGLIPQLKRWFAGGTSDAVREWVEQFMELKTCPTCNGARLKIESLWFKVDEKNIAELSELNLDKLMKWFEALKRG